MPPAIALPSPLPPDVPPTSSKAWVILARRSDTALESRRHEVTDLRLLCSVSPSLTLSLSSLTKLAELGKLSVGELPPSLNPLLPVDRQVDFARS